MPVMEETKSTAPPMAGSGHPDFAPIASRWAEHGHRDSGSHSPPAGVDTEDVESELAMLEKELGPEEARWLLNIAQKAVDAPTADDDSNKNENTESTEQEVQDVDDDEDDEDDLAMLELLDQPLVRARSRGLPPSVQAWVRSREWVNVGGAYGKTTPTPTTRTSAAAGAAGTEVKRHDYELSVLSEDDEEQLRVAEQRLRQQQQYLSEDADDESEEERGAGHERRRRRRRRRRGPAFMSASQSRASQLEEEHRRQEQEAWDQLQMSVRQLAFMLFNNWGVKVGAWFAAFALHKSEVCRELRQRFPFW